MKFIYRSQLTNVYGQASTKGPGIPRPRPEKAVASHVESVEMGTIENARYKEQGGRIDYTHTFGVFQCNWHYFKSYTLGSPALDEEGALRKS